MSERNADMAETQNKRKGWLGGVDCPVCLNKGYVVVVRDDDLVQVRCKCMDARECISRIENSGLKHLMEDYTFDNYDAPEAWQTAVKNKAKTYLTKGGSSWFFVGGQVGSGKTHICTALTGELLKSGNRARYMLWRDEATPLKASVNDDEYERNIKPYKTVDILYIDDFLKIARGTSPIPTQGDLNLAFEIINARYNDKNLITIISSEHSIDTIISFDEAIGSRIYERSKGYCTNIPNNQAANYRLRGRKT